MTAAALVVEDGTEIVLVAGVDALWHLPRDGEESLARKTLCGLAGPTYAYGAHVRDRRACTVCAARAPKGLLKRRRKPGAKPRGKPRGKWGKVTELQVRALHIAHWEQRVPINELGRRYWQRFGYASANACANSLSRYFVELDLPRHDRIEMCVQASTVHGRARRRRPKNGGKFGNGSKSAGYKRWLLNERAGGETRNPICDQLTARGKACTHRALDGKTHCHSHDPEQREEMGAQLAAMRTRSPLHDPARVEPSGPTAELLRGYRAGGGQWRALARRTDLPEHWLAHVAAGAQRNVSRHRAQRVRDALVPLAAAA